MAPVEQHESDAAVARRAPSEAHSSHTGFAWPWSAGSFLHTVLDGVAEAITVHDGGGRVMYANARARAILPLVSALTEVHARSAAVSTVVDARDRRGNPVQLSEALTELRRVPQGTRRLRILSVQNGAGRRWLAVRLQQCREDVAGSDLTIAYWHELGRLSKPHPRRTLRAYPTATITRLERTAARGEFLEQLTLLLGAPTRTGLPDRQLAQLLAEKFGGLCVIDLADERAGRPVRTAHVVDDQLHPRAWLLEDLALHPQDASSVQALIEAGQGTRQEDFALADEGAQANAWVFPSAAQVDCVSGMGVASLLGVPIVFGAQPLGLLTVARLAGRPRWSAEDEALLAEVAVRVGFELERTRRLASLERALEDRDELLMAAAHELKTPLASLMLYLQATERRLDTRDDTAPEWVQARLRTCTRQAQQLRLLSERLLGVAALSGRKTFSSAHVDVRALLVDVAERMSSTLQEAGCTMHLDLEDASCITDPVWVDEVVSNLVENACKYARDRPIDLRVRQNERDVEISVEDHGPGIPEELRKRLFGRFQRGAQTNPRDGTGLGLYVARQVVSVLGGTLNVRTTVGGGATFVITLPRREAANH